MSCPISRIRPQAIALIVLAVALVGLIRTSIFLLTAPSPLRIPNNSNTAVLHLGFSPDGTKLLLRCVRSGV